MQETVLVVDPNIEFLDRTRQILEEEGYHFLQAMHWEEAQMRLQEERVDSLLVNVGIDAEMGKSLLQYARQEMGLTCGLAMMVGQNDEPPTAEVAANADILLYRPMRSKELFLALQALTAIRVMLEGGYSMYNAAAESAPYEDYQEPEPLDDEPTPVPAATPTQENVSAPPPSDEDTPLYPMSWFRRLAVLEVKRAIHFRQPLSLLLLSYDMTEDFIASHAEETLEDLAEALAFAVSQATREIDLPVQFSRDHILVLLPNTGVEIVIQEATRLKDETSALLYREFEGTIVPPSISVGATTSSTLGMFKFTDLLKDATRALREVRSKGGDDVGYC